MVNYMVAIDDSKYSKAAFFTAAFMMDKQRDRLYLITVVSDIAAWIMEDIKELQKMQNSVNDKGNDILMRFELYCRALKVNYELILGVSDHIGAQVCEQVDKKKVDFLVVGRRGLSGIKRMFVGSTSRYCMENANCCVIITKGEWGPAEEHSDLKSVIDQEEQERASRVKAENELIQQEEIQRKFESELDKNITRLAEETERLIRMKEDHDQQLKENADRVAAHIGAVIDEEKERKRRIKDDGIREERQIHVEIYSPK